MRYLEGLEGREEQREEEREEEREERERFKGEIRPVGEEFLRGVSGESRVGCVYGMEGEGRVEVVLCDVGSLVGKK